MSFLNQLKTQATSLNSGPAQTGSDIETNTRQTELACKTVWIYVSELCKHLNVLAPAGPRFGMDKYATWPAMKLHNFRVDSRKKKLRNQEVYDSISIGWTISPIVGAPTLSAVDVDFGPALERVEKILSAGSVKFERKDIIVQQDKKQRRVIRFEFTTQASGYITVTADHDKGVMNFRLSNAAGFGVKNIAWPVDSMQSPLLDEMAKMIVAQPNQFLPATIV